MKVKYIDYYSIASNLVLCSLVIGFINLFLRDLTKLEDLAIAILILVIRYFSVILIKRRFSLAKYLLLILIARNIYKLFVMPTGSFTEIVAISIIAMQIVMTVTALFFITKLPYKFEIKRKITNA